MVQKLGWPIFERVFRLTHIIIDIYATSAKGALFETSLPEMTTSLRSVVDCARVSKSICTSAIQYFIPFQARKSPVWLSLLSEESCDVILVSDKTNFVTITI